MLSLNLSLCCGRVLFVHRCSSKHEDAVIGADSILFIMLFELDAQKHASSRSCLAGTLSNSLKDEVRKWSESSPKTISEYEGKAKLLKQSVKAEK